MLLGENFLIILVSYVYLLLLLASIIPLDCHMLAICWPYAGPMYNTGHESEDDSGSMSHELRDKSVLHMEVVSFARGSVRNEAI